MISARPLSRIVALLIFLITSITAVAQQARLVQDITTGGDSYPSSLVRVDDDVYFSTYYGPRFMRTDGTTAGTVDLQGEFMEDPVAVGSHLFFVVTGTGRELWHLDPVTGQQSVVKDIFPGWEGSDPSSLTSGSGLLFFAANDGIHGKELWISDGTESGTTLVLDINSTGSSTPRNFVEYNGAVYFVADDDSGKPSLWRSDGTTAGTFVVTTVGVGKLSFAEPLLVVYNGLLYFSGTTPSTGTELWRTDGTSAGTTIVADIVPGAGSGSPALGIVALGRLFFLGFASATGYEPYAYDAATQTVSLVKDVNPGASSSFPAYFIELNGAVLFQASHPSYGGELWRSDGTAAGTTVVDTQPGTVGAGFQTPVKLGSHVYFGASTSANGSELWMTDGTAAGTHIAADLVPGSGNSYPGGFTVLGDSILFAATTPQTGVELFALDTCETTAPIAGIHSTQIYDDPGFGTVVRNGDNIEACGNPTVRLIPLALNVSYSYSWSTGATTAVLDVTTSGTYTVTVTSPSGCATTSSVTVHYGAFPAKPTIAATATELCPAGGSVTLTAPAADAWTWSNGGTTQSIIVTESGSYTVRVRSGACDSELSDPIVITTGTSTITTNDSLALCGPGSSATLTANDGTAWLWSNGATTRSIVVTQPGTYSVTTTNNGCTMPQSSPVTVTARSVSIDANGPTTFCGGTNVTLTANGGTSWLWSNGATTQSITVYASGNYGVTATFADGCVLAAAPVTVDAHQVTASVTADRTTVCENGSIQLSATATGGAGYTYQWYDNTYAPIAGATSSTLTITPATSGFVYVKVQDELGCEATSNSTIYTVLPTPDATITTAAAICEGQTGSASVADGGPNVTYSWTITNGSLFFPNASSVTFTPNGLEPVTLTVTVANAGCSVTSSKSVTVNPLPQAVITPSGSPTFCSGGSVTLTASAGASYLWSNGATTQSIVVNATNNYTVTVTNAAGCSAMSAPTSVVVNANPATPVITPSGPTTFCAGGSVTLTAPAGFTYLWSNGAITQSIVVSATGNYTVTVTNASGCSAISAPTSVTVNAATTIGQHPQNVTIPKNTSATLTVTATGTGTLTFQWYRGTSPSTATPISGATSSSYTTPKLTKGAYTYWVRVTGTCSFANSNTATVTAQ